MTELEKMQAITLKGKGKGYKVIASLLSLSENTVKSFLRREYKEEKFPRRKREQNTNPVFEKFYL